MHNSVLNDYTVSFNVSMLKLKGHENYFWTSLTLDNTELKTLSVHMSKTLGGYLTLE